ncbi:MAG: hypothetical protein QM602_08125 [Microbacterium sp.]
MTASPPVELVAGALYAAGGNIPLDGRVSWAPVAPGYQPLNAYVLTREEPIVIDPGVPAVEAGFMRGMRELLPEGSGVRVFISRSQMDCIGNMAPLIKAYRVREVFTGGNRNPFDQFDEVRPDEDRSAEPMGVRRSPEDSGLEIYRPALRILSTFWAYDAATKAVFTSDSFTHASSPDDEYRPILSSGDDDPTTVDDVRAHLYANLWWMPYAEKAAIAADVRAFFETHDVEIVAPDRGRILVGKDVIAGHLDMLLGILDEAPILEDVNG